MTPDKNAPYADFIKALPLADLPSDVVKGYLLSAPQGQVAFFEVPAGATFPPHSHGPQWGIVVQGSGELTIGGKTAVYEKGDSYYIPAGVEHSIKVLSDLRAIDVFADPDRYAPQK